MRAVLDTNVVISATLARGGNEDRILRAWRRRAFELVLSPAILEEMARALFYARIQRARWLTEQETIELIELLAHESVLVPGKARLRVSRDPEDDKFLSAALDAEAEYVVTGDRDLLDLGAYRTVRVVAPATFLKILADREQPRT